MNNRYLSLQKKWLKGLSIVLMAAIFPVLAAEPAYKPPGDLGAPSGRVGGGSRSIVATENPQIIPLEPAHVGQTSTATPTLYWVVLKSIDKPIEVTLVDRTKTMPEEILSTRLEPPILPGIHTLTANRENPNETGSPPAKLEAGTVYEWNTAIIWSEKNRSLDQVAKGWILYKPIERNSETAKQLANADLVKQVNIYAAAGYWYDAIATLSNQLAAHPEDAELKAARTALLEQVGLQKATIFDK